MKYNKYARILAWLALFIIVALIVLFLYCAFTGKNFFGSLFLIIVIPVIIWVILFFAGCFHEDKPDDEKSESSSEEE